MFNHFKGSYPVKDDNDSSNGIWDYDKGYDNIIMRSACLLMRMVISERDDEGLFCGNYVMFLTGCLTI